MKLDYIKELTQNYEAYKLCDMDILSILLGEKCVNSIKEKGIYTLNAFRKLSEKEMLDIENITKDKLIKIKAILELNSRNFKYGDKTKIGCPQDIYSVSLDMEQLNQEVLRLYCLNTKNIIIGTIDVFKGGLNASIVHPREIFSEALKRNSASIIVCHNHPSGDSTPSKEDINITLRLVESGKILGIELLDHVIVGKGNYTSLKEKGLM